MKNIIYRSIIINSIYFDFTSGILFSRLENKISDVKSILYINHYILKFSRLENKIPDVKSKYIELIIIDLYIMKSIY